MFENLKTHHRWLLEADLRPVQGDRFQPTGFADLGAARYLAPDGDTWMLLVESAQSVANRLEATILAPDGELDPELAGLSYIQVQLEGASDAKTNSMLEAHRINSPFIISDKDFQQRFVEMSGYGKNRPLHWPSIARALFRFDVNSLLHGCFLANLEDGRVRTPRALTGFVEAAGVREAVSGGVKNNPIDPTGTLRATAHDKDVYGNVPYQRVEYTATRITAYFNLDLGLLRGFGLPDPAFELLVALGLLKVRRFLDGGLRLRTACDLRLDGPPRVTAPEGGELPDEASLLAATRAAIRGCAELLGDPPVTELTTMTKVKGKKDQE
ncbi:MAG: type I-U CRISPR-associated RAMP protein Csb1/Cas7u [Pseudomonadota bacterium]